MHRALPAAIAAIAACSTPASRPSVHTSDPTPVAPASDAAGPATPPPPSYDRIERLEFNQRAAAAFLPLFWRADSDGDRTLDPDELVVLWGYGGALPTLVEDGDFTAGFAALYQRLADPPVLTGLEPGQARRRALVAAELAQGRPTLVESDFRTASAEDRAVVDHVLAAAAVIEHLYARQVGVAGLGERIADDDPASRMLLYRNQNAVCVAPRTESEPDCSPLTDKSRPPSGLYPAAIQAKPDFCAALAAAPNGDELMDHFAVVVEGDAPGTFRAVPYQIAFADDMNQVAAELDAAAAAVTSADEQAFVAYLRAAAAAFRSGDWESADAAWAEMGRRGSRWYLRIAPDEVYDDPCAVKAGFHVSFARINPASLAWRDKLDPVKGEMEAALAKLAGRPYRARKVRFALPDFIDIIVNAGDSRSPHGATVGQSLPNWGKVAEAGGRTMATTNLYTDPDSDAVFLTQTGSLLCPASQALVTTDDGPGLMSVVLHEAAHNLGPSHDYKVRGKTDDQAFGGPIASTMEELKAQTSALYFADWLVDRGLITQAEADAAHLRDVTWAFAQTAQGMYTGSGRIKPYPQLAAIQLGTLLQDGVLIWRPDQAAAGGDQGCLDVDLKAWKPSVERLARRVLRAKARADRKDALAMKAAFVDGPGPWAELRATITERWLRAPKASFVYAVHR